MSNRSRKFDLLLTYVLEPRLPGISSFFVIHIISVKILTKPIFIIHIPIYTPTLGDKTQYWINQMIMIYIIMMCSTFPRYTSNTEISFFVTWFIWKNSNCFEQYLIFMVVRVKKQNNIHTTQLLNGATYIRVPQTTF